MQFEKFTEHKLDDTCSIFTGQLPTELVPDQDSFETFWNLHPEAYHSIKLFEKVLKTPRWQQAYNKDYQYSGSKNNAEPVPEILKPYWQWCQDNIHTELNGLLLNWYDGSLGHYIGKHRDSIDGLVQGTPIVTISFGQERIFRMRPWQGTGFKDFKAENGDIVIIPWDTNMNWTHEVPKFKKYAARRISVTLREFT